MIYTEAPADFVPAFDVASLFLEHADDILLLLRQDHKPQGNHWGVPAGKAKKDESPKQTMLRELKEETGVILQEQDLVPLQKLYVRYPDFDFIYYMFQTKLTGDRPDIVIDPESHKDLTWVKPQDASALQLIPDLDACIQMTYML
ncbi:MAG TPA: NUDIX hydrolase [Alphaproteobacteria bacterium]